MVEDLHHSDSEYEPIEEILLKNFIMTPSHMNILFHNWK
jgi:hypothetical protein